MKNSTEITKSEINALYGKEIILFDGRIRTVVGWKMNPYTKELLIKISGSNDLIRSEQIKEVK